MIITSLLDTDLYKFTMMQVVLHHFPAAQVEYRFKCRNVGVDLTPCVDEIRDEVAKLCQLRFTPDELRYLRELRFIKSDFVDFLGLFEVPLLAIVNEVYFRRTQPQPDWEEGRRRLEDKLALLKMPAHADCVIADYGSRRRFSRDWQDEVLQTMRRVLGPQLAGTSNAHFARLHNLTPLGTMAHEYLQACQALGPRLRDSQVFALEVWAKEYRGDLGIALSDTYGFDAFLRDFDPYFCKLFDGVRHDSGDPFAWGERMLAHYAANRVDPLGKTLIFSDSLDIPRVIELCERFGGRCRLAFGVGTNLTNDLGYTPLQIVIKMTRCNGQPVAKLADTPEKTMCDDPAYLAYLRHVFSVKAPALEAV
jgi:nicotinate phosphoribosyltransferase